MTNDTCSECAAPLTQKPGARRVACAGGCSEARTKRLLREAYLRRRDTGQISADAKRKAHKKWRDKNRDAEIARSRAWHDANRERTAAYDAEYRRANAEQVRAKNLRRRARLMSAFDEDVDLIALFVRDKGICGICGDAVDPDIAWPHKRSKTLDHIVPLIRGGRHSWANAQLAHAQCNSRKGDRY